MFDGVRRLLPPAILGSGWGVDGRRYAWSYVCARICSLGRRLFSLSSCSVRYTACLPRAPGEGRGSTGRTIATEGAHPRFRAKDALCTTRALVFPGAAGLPIAVEPRGRSVLSVSRLSTRRALSPQQEVGAGGTKKRGCVGGTCTLTVHISPFI